MTSLFQLVLKTAKVVLAFTKDSKLDCSNYCPIYLIPNIEKILEKLIYKRLHTFLNNSIIYNLLVRFKQKYSTYHALKVTSDTKR